MKAIKDCEWEVRIYKTFGELNWYACTPDEQGLDSKILGGNHEYAEERSVKQNWRKFAKLNGIKNWRFV